MKTIRD